MDQEFYQNLLNKYDRTGYIGKCRPFNKEHAKQIAWSIANKKQQTKINNTSVTPAQGTEPLRLHATCVQLSLF